MIKLTKEEFLEGLITTRDKVRYEKKEVDLYDPEKEIEDKFYADYIDEEEEKENKMIDGYNEDEEIFNTYNVTEMEFSNKRISQKFELNLVPRYKDIIDRETLFGFCLDIITKQSMKEIKGDYIHIAEKKTIKDKKLGYHDDITTINVMIDTRINRKINKWRGTEGKTKDGVTTFYAPLFVESLETEMSINQTENQDSDTPKTIGDKITDQTNIFYDELSEYTEEEIDNRLSKMYEKAKLTNREIEVLQALERTPNNDKGNTYTRALAGKMLGCTGQNISNIFNNAKKKIMEIYGKETRYNLLEEIEDFLNIAEDEKQVIDFILDHLVKEYINYILYDSDLNSSLVQYFNKNNQNESMYYTDLMREFCTYFLKEVYTYKEMTEYNIKKQELPEPEGKKVEEPEGSTFIDTNIYTYIAESKLENHEKKGKFILIDKEKYYYVKSSKQAKEEKKKENYKTLTFLKR